MNKSISAMGVSRIEHVANISMANESWADYTNNHEAVFAKNGLEKFVLLNGEGQVVARNSAAAELVKNKLYTNASSTLRHEDYLTIQDMITEVRRRKLNGIDDLQANGLSFPVSIGDQIVGTENMTEFGDAKQEQNPTGYDGDDTEFSMTYVPNPITHKTFGVPFRQTGFAYKSSAGLKEAMRKVAERLEKTLFKGNSGIVVDMGGIKAQIHGYTTHPKRGTGTISDWSNKANFGVVYDETNALINKMFADQGGVEMNSVCLYYPKNFKLAFNSDYVPGFPSETNREHMLKGIPELRDIKFAEYLDDSEIVLVEMSDRTVQLAVASDIIAVPHVKTNPLASQEVTTYAAMTPIIKADSNGATGIMHATVA